MTTFKDYIRDAINEAINLKDQGEYDEDTLDRITDETVEKISDSLSRLVEKE